MSLGDEKKIFSFFNFLKRIYFTDLGTVPSLCYHLDEAILVENGNNIYFSTNLQVKSLFLLGEGERRYREIAESDVTKYRRHFRLNERFRDMASLEIINFKGQLGILPEVPIIGMYVRTLQVVKIYNNITKP